MFHTPFAFNPTVSDAVHFTPSSLYFQIQVQDRRKDVRQLWSGNDVGKEGTEETFLLLLCIQRRRELNFFLFWSRTTDISSNDLLLLLGKREKYPGNGILHFEQEEDRDLEVKTPFKEEEK